MLNTRFQNRIAKMIASILVAGVLFGMLPGCKKQETTESITATTTTVAPTTTITETTETTTVETTEPYSDINWSVDSEEAFYTYMLNTYNIKLNYYIFSFGLDDYLNQYFTEYVNLTRGTSYDYVPWEVTKTYFTYMLHHHTMNVDLNGPDDDLYNNTSTVLRRTFVNYPNENQWVDFETLSVLYFNDITFGNRIGKEVYDKYYTNSSECYQGTAHSILLYYNYDISTISWYIGEFSPDINMFEQSSIDIYKNSFNDVYEEFGIDIHPTVGEPITKELLLAMFPDRAEEIEELAAQKEAAED